MPGPDGFLISEDEERTLIQRLADGDVTAPSDLARLFLDHLIEWLKATNSRQIPEELFIEAAEDAIIALGKSPKSFDRARGKRLTSYLRMSAKGDLLNILKREARQQIVKFVEVSDEVGNSPVVEEDPLLQLECQEEAAMASNEVVSPACQGLSEAECRAMRLILRRERKTAVFASALGILHLSPKEQKIEVKRVKDKLKMRLKRERDSNVKPS